MKFGVVIFPGSNCDYDCYHVIEQILKEEVSFIWHNDGAPLDYDCVILPGGFSYGDYLRPGAMAKFAPAMEKVAEFAQEGGLVLGICNGFQILLEAGLLPGAMLRNRGLRFICQDTYVRVERAETPFTNLLKPGQVLKIPINHYEGNYVADQESLKELQSNRQVIFRYCDSRGNVTDEANPNGSALNIAGLLNLRGNVLGMMPHPERCAEAELGGKDGALIFSSLVRFLKER